MSSRVYHIETGEIIVSPGAGPYARPRSVFVPIDEAASRCDEVRGDLDALPDNAVIYIGDTTAKYYWRSNDPADIPLKHRGALDAHDYVIVDGIGGGWVRWEGRPEWSDRYIDVSSAEVIAHA